MLNTQHPLKVSSSSQIRTRGQSETLLGGLQKQASLQASLQQGVQNTSISGHGGRKGSDNAPIDGRPALVTPDADD